MYLGSDESNYDLVSNNNSVWLMRNMPECPYRNPVQYDALHHVGTGTDSVI